MNIRAFLDKEIGGVFQGTQSNQYKACPKYLEVNIDNEKFMNKLYKMLKSSDLYTLQRSPSGAIRKGPRYITNMYAWDIKTSSIGAMITVIVDGYTYVVKYGNYKGQKAPEVYPSEAFNMFSEKCLECGINLNDYKIPNGAEVKQTIEAPLIKMYETHGETHKGLTNVHHIDFHNSYPAGLANTHPEFKPVVEYFYYLRKVYPEYKAVLNYTIGYMQSLKGGKNADWAHLSRDAIKDNNDRILALTTELILSGRRVIGHNTDGIWYQGSVYHGPGEGFKLGEWENDHTNCRFRAKSDGSYEFIENGEYHAVVRGSTSKDEIEPDRSKWQWGDIYCLDKIKFKFDSERGFYHEKEL